MIRIDGLYKIYGEKPLAALELLKNGGLVEEVKESTGQVPAVNNVSLEAKRNEAFVIMGLSGSGKSSLIRCINRLIEPTAGSIYLKKGSEGRGEIEINSLGQKELRQIRRNRISMVFQEFALLPHRSVLQNVVYGLKIKGEENIDSKGKNILEQVGLQGWEEAYPDELSGGMKQRVGVARALVTDTDVVLMDEPFSALDPLIRRQMQEWFLEEVKTKFRRTLFFITHDLQEALRLGDRVAIMKKGKMVQVGSSKEILDNPADEYVESFVKDIRELAAR